jgi:hypothetical protein
MKQPILIIVLLALACFSCEKEWEKTDIGSDILISLGSTELPYSLIAETDSVYPCTGYEIVTKVRSGPANFTISFRHIREWKTCLTSPDVASVEIPLGYLVQDKYDVEFRLEGRKFPAVFEVFPDGSAEFRFDGQGQVRLK